MDRLLAWPVNTGQPLRPEDWAFIQDTVQANFKALLLGLNAPACIIHGLVVNVASGTLSVGEGMIFDGEEISYVAPALFEFHGTPDSSTGDWLLYLTQIITTGENRNFKNGETHDVWQYRRYEMGYAESVPPGSIAWSGLKLLIDCIAEYVADNLPPAAGGIEIKERRVSFSSDELDQLRILVPAPGAGKVIQVLSISCKNTVSSSLDVGNQLLNISYGDDPTTFAVGRFNNQFLESLTTAISECTYMPNRQYDNQPVIACYSGETKPLKGASVFTFIVLYKIIEY